MNLPGRDVIIIMTVLSNAGTMHAVVSLEYPLKATCMLYYYTIAGWKGADCKFYTRS